jgi:hypothetical protein
MSSCKPKLRGTNGCHNPLRVGTLNGILRAVAIHKRVDRQALLDSLR